jgi:hypothetical protein
VSTVVRRARQRFWRVQDSFNLTMLDRIVAIGATPQFLTNLSAIIAAGSIVFLVFGFRPDPGERFRAFSRSIVAVVVFPLVISTTLAVLTVRTMRSRLLDREIGSVLAAEMGTMEDVELLSWQVDGNGNSPLCLHVRVQTARELSASELLAFQERTAGRLQRPARLLLSVVPVTQFDISATVVPVAPMPSMNPGKN